MCDVLKSAAAAYFGAIAQRDPRPLREVRITENGKPAREFLQTGGKLHFSRQLIDTEACGILTWGVIDETIDGATAPIILAVRVALEAGKIAAIEVILHRKEENYFNPQAFIDNAKQSSSPEAGAREAMVQASVSATCQRWEGGVRTGCPPSIEIGPTLVDPELGTLAAFTTDGVEILQLREGKIERIDAIVGGRR